jgi:large subunit ribosomal protein L3
MPTTRTPRRGSLQFWPRKRSSRPYARVRTWNTKNSGLLSFPGYKVGMTNVQYLDSEKNSLTKNEIISVPCTVVECPPVSIFSVRFYKKAYQGKVVASEIRNSNLDKSSSRRVTDMKKKTSLPEALPEGTTEVRVCLMTLPVKTALEKKKPEIYEVKLGGSLDDQFNFVKENFVKEINLADVFKAGQFIDLHGVTKGKGFQGVIKRHGAKTKRAKSEKGTRHAIAGSEGMAKVMYTSPRTGKMGYHLRTQYNAWILKITETPDFEPFKHYGIPKNPCILIKGSVQGPCKRLVTLTRPIRAESESKQAPEIKL